MVRRREPVIIPDVSARFAHFKDATHGSGRVKGWMGVPLLFGDSLIGMLTLDKLDADLVVIAFTTKDLQKAFEASTLVKNMSAVKKGNYFVTDVETISQLRSPSALGIPWALNNLEAGFAKLDK